MKLSLFVMLCQPIGMTQIQSIAGRRAKGRLRLGLEGTLDMVSGAVRCEIVDLSNGGARLSLPQPPRVGSWCVLVLDKVEAFGQVVWRRDRLCGLQFEQPISDAILLEFLQRCDELLKAQLAREPTERLEFARSWVNGG